MVTFKTGQKAPSTGTYEVVSCTNGKSCKPTAEERYIPLSKGETFPPLKSQERGAVYRRTR